MSIKINSTVILKIKPSEYNLLMYLRFYKINLENIKPGSIVLHFSNDNKIRKHELHFYGNEFPMDDLPFDRNFEACYTNNKECETSKTE